MNTKEAFEQLISQRGWWKELGITENKSSMLRSNHKKGKVTIDKMEEILELAGYKVVQEKIWENSGYSVDGKL